MFKRIWVCGDIHGSKNPIENFWRRNKDNIDFSSNTDCIILLGDVGANYFLNHRDKEFKQQLEKFPFTYFCIRGNHEERPLNLIAKNPNNWYLKKFFENNVYVENDFPNINYALDNITTYNINGYKTLIIPGAYSVDKYYRLVNGWSWFKDEQLSSEEMEGGRRIIEDNNYNFDIILSHTCPIIYEPTDIFLSVVDQSLVDKTMERYLGEIEYNTNYKLWLWGHFHTFRIYPQFNHKQCIMLSAGREILSLQECIDNLNNIYNIKKY